MMEHSKGEWGTTEGAKKVSNPSEEKFEIRDRQNVISTKETPMRRTSCATFRPSSRHPRTRSQRRLLLRTTEQSFDAFNLKSEIFFDEFLCSFLIHVLIDDFFNHTKHAR